jgi:membrane protease YdiL (CAAX protease family)
MTAQCTKPLCIKAAYFSIKIVKEFSAVALIYIIGTTVLPMALPASIAMKVTLIAIAGPIREEIFFRGTLLSGIEYSQKCTNFLRQLIWKTKFSEADIKAQKSFRISLTSWLFGLSHITNYRTIGPFVFWQVFIAKNSGYRYGMLKEETNSLIPSTAIHIINNSLLVPSFLAFQAQNYYLAIPLYLIGCRLIDISSQYLYDKFIPAPVAAAKSQS